MASLSSIFFAAGRLSGSTFRRRAANSNKKKNVPSAYLPAPAKKSNEIRVFLKSTIRKHVVDRVGELELFNNCSCGTMDERLPQTIAEAFACKFPE